MDKTNKVREPQLYVRCVAIISYTHLNGTSVYYGVMLRKRTGENCGNMHLLYETLAQILINVKHNLDFITKHNTTMYLYSYVIEI